MAEREISTRRVAVEYGDKYGAVLFKQEFPDGNDAAAGLIGWILQSRSCLIAGDQVRITPVLLTNSEIHQARNTD